MGYPYSYSEGTSECCGADVYHGICMECRDHCDLVEDEEEVEEDPKMDIDQAIFNLKVLVTSKGCGDKRYTEAIEVLEKSVYKDWL
jgi:hypothetical protein